MNKRINRRVQNNQSEGKKCHLSVPDHSDKQKILSNPLFTVLLPPPPLLLGKAAIGGIIKVHKPDIFIVDAVITESV